MQSYGSRDWKGRARLSPEMFHEGRIYEKRARKPRGAGPSYWPSVCSDRPDPGGSSLDWFTDWHTLKTTFHFGHLYRGTGRK